MWFWQLRQAASAFRVLPFPLGLLPVLPRPLNVPLSPMVLLSPVLLPSLVLSPA